MGGRDFAEERPRKKVNEFNSMRESQCLKGIRLLNSY